LPLLNLANGYPLLRSFGKHDSFGTKDKEKVNLLLTKAQNALSLELAKDQSNAELLVMQAMINTAWISFDL
jgi:3-dehydroquinate dehydratase